MVDALAAAYRVARLVPVEQDEAQALRRNALIS